MEKYLASTKDRSKLSGASGTERERRRVEEVYGREKCKEREEEGRNREGMEGMWMEGKWMGYGGENVNGKWVMVMVRGMVRVCRGMGYGGGSKW